MIAESVAVKPYEIVLSDFESLEGTDGPPLRVQKSRPNNLDPDDAE